MANILLGIDLGGTKIEIIALENTVTTQSNILFRRRTATPKHSNADTQYQLILQAISQLVLDCEKQLIKDGALPTTTQNQTQNLPLGIGIPGALSLKTGLVKNANTTCLIAKDLKQDLTHALNRTVTIENDANCFALSEAVDGAGAQQQSIFAVILGTGVGGGFAIHGQILKGKNSIAGEWGHNPLPWPEAQDEPKQTCYCGLSGCIETYLSGPGCERQNALQFKQSISSKDFSQNHHFNTHIQNAYQHYVKRLAKSLASVINIMDPDVIVLGGGLSNILSLYEDVPKVWGDFIFSDDINTELKQNVHGDSSGVRGAAWLNK